MTWRFRLDASWSANADARSTRWKKTGRAGTTICTRAQNGSTYIRGLSLINLYSKHHNFQERNPHMDHAFTMQDSLALARLILYPIVRSLIFATSAFIGVSVAYVLYILIRRRISAYRSPLRNLPGPSGAHWFRGNFTEVQETDSSRLLEEWVQKYGHVLMYQSHLWVRFLFFTFLFFSFFFSSLNYR